MLTRILFLAILIFLNAFFSAAEIALISLNDKLIKKQAEEGDKKAQQIHKFLSEPGRFLATIQIGITLAGFLASAIAAESFVGEIVTLLMNAGLPVSEVVLKNIVLILITLILSYFTLVFGELVPKRIAMQKSDVISKVAVGPLSFLSYISSPFVKFLTGSTNFFIKLFGGNPSQADDERVTEEEIRMMIEVGEERGTIQDTEKEMIDNIFDFDNKQVSEIMTHRTEVVAIPVDSDLQTILEIMDKDKYTRVPVYKDNIDNIVGVLHVKDLIHCMKKKEEEFDIGKIIRSPYFVPDSKRTDKLFQEMQKNKVNLAVVIDEYGGTAGIVTMEDLVEEIVGNIFDEYDVEEKDVEILDGNTFVLDGTLSLDRVEEILDQELPVEDYDTLSGFVVGLLGRIPEKDENPVVEYEDVVFKVIGMEGKRITKIKASKKIIQNEL